jgi:hypothetical protein
VGETESESDNSWIFVGHDIQRLSAASHDPASYPRQYERFGIHSLQASIEVESESLQRLAPCFYSISAIRVTRSDVVQGSDISEDCPEQGAAQNVEITNSHPSKTGLARLHTVYWVATVDHLIDYR